MNCRRSYYVNNVDVTIVSNLVEVVVFVDILLIKVVLCRPFFSLFRMASHNACKITILGLAQRRPEFAGCIPAESEECDAKFSVRFVFRRLRAKLGSSQCCKSRINIKK